MYSMATSHVSLLGCDTVRHAMHTNKLECACVRVAKRHLEGERLDLGFSKRPALLEAAAVLTEAHTHRQ